MGRCRSGDVGLDRSGGGRKFHGLFQASRVVLLRQFRGERPQTLLFNSEHETLRQCGPKPGSVVDCGGNLVLDVFPVGFEQLFVIFFSVPRCHRSKIPGLRGLAPPLSANYPCKVPVAKNIRTLEDNLDLRTHPADCEERGYTQPLEVPEGIANGDIMCTFLEAAGWVRLNGEGGAGKFAPPLAGYVAGALRSCVFDRNEAGRMVGAAGYRAGKEPLRILDAPGGRVPAGVAVPSPRALTAAMALKILASRGVDLDEAREEISSWVSALQDMIPDNEDAINAVGARSGRAYSHRGELLVSIDRQTGSLSFLPTGDAMGPEGPYCQKTKVYDPDSRKAPLAVIFHRGSAVRANAARANPKALEKSLYATMRGAIAREIVDMAEEEFEEAFGAKSMGRLADFADKPLAEAMNALGMAARRLREDGRGDMAEEKAARLVSEMNAFGGMLDRPRHRGARSGGEREITNPLDLLLAAAGEYPWLFPTYAGKEVHRKGVIHLHGVSGRMLREMFRSMQESDDFVLHDEADEGYGDTYQAPFESTIENLARELDGEGARASRRALQRARTKIQEARQGGSVGFLELVKGRGVVLRDDEPLEPVRAMGALLGPTRGALGGDDTTLGEISIKIDALTAKLRDGGEESGIGSIRDFASRILRKPEVSRELFGERGLAALRAARAALVRAEKGAEEGKEAKCGAEKAALQAAVCDCLCHYFFGTDRPEPDSRRQLVDKLVVGAANCEFVYFAAQAGAEGLLKIGKAVDVDSRMSELSKEGHDVLPLAYIAIPGIPVGDWALSSVGAAAGLVGGVEASKRATKAVNRLTGLYGNPESGGAAEFFVGAVKFAMVQKAASGAGDLAKRNIADLSEGEVEELLTESKLVRGTTARSVHAIIRAVHESAEPAGGTIEKQKKIREASAATLSLLAAENAWERIPAGGDGKIRSGFYEVDEATQMPKRDEAWAHRVQTGALVAERALHRKYQGAKVHGEWFYLLAATEAVVRDAEREFSTKAEVCCGGGVGRVVSDLQRSGQQVCARTELLPADRGDWYQAEVERVQAEEYGVRLQKGIADADGRGRGARPSRGSVGAER